MTPTLEDVKGLGAKKSTLEETGIDSVEKLAKAEVDDLVALKGIGKATAEKLIANAKDLLEVPESGEAPEVVEEKESETPEVEDEKIKEEIKKLDAKKKKLQGKKVEIGDFVLVKITAKTQKGKIFRVSSEEDAKKVGIYDEKNAQQGYYTPEFVIVGKPGFLNEGLTEFIESSMNYFEKKSVRVPPIKAFGKRDPSKIERIGIAKFRKLNEGKNPELGQDFVRRTPQGQSQRGTVIRVSQGKVVVDYNHPLAGQSVDYNLEIIDKIEDFNDKIEYFMVNKGIPQDNIPEFTINYDKKEKTVEITIPKMFLFQNLTYVKFGLAMDLQTHMSDEVGDVKFIEIYEKIPIPEAPADTVMQKVEEFNKEQESDQDQE